MATIRRAPSRYVEGWKVTWVEKDSSGKTVMSRSKILEDRGAAVTFKCLVEDAGDRYPSVAVLTEHRLSQYAEPIPADVVYHALKLLEKNADDPKDAVEQILPILRWHCTGSWS